MLNIAAIMIDSLFHPRFHRPSWIGNKMLTDAPAKSQHVFIRDSFRDIQAAGHKYGAEFCYDAQNRSCRLVYKWRTIKSKHYF